MTKVDTLIQTAVRTGQARATIVATLNKEGIKTARGNAWTTARLNAYMNKRQISARNGASTGTITRTAGTSGQVDFATFDPYIFDLIRNVVLAPEVTPTRKIEFLQSFLSH